MISLMANLDTSDARNANNIFDKIDLLRFDGYNVVAGFSENVTIELVSQNPHVWLKTYRSLQRTINYTITYRLKYWLFGSHL